MKITEILDLRDAVPFVPFSVELNSGRIIPVPSHDHLFVPPNKQYVVVANDHLYVVDLENVAALVVGQ